MWNAFLCNVNVERGKYSSLHKHFAFYTKASPSSVDTANLYSKACRGSHLLWITCQNLWACWSFFHSKLSSLAAPALSVSIDVCVIPCLPAAFQIQCNCLFSLLLSLCCSIYLVRLGSGLAVPSDLGIRKIIPIKIMLLPGAPRTHKHCSQSADFPRQMRG